MWRNSWQWKNHQSFLCSLTPCEQFTIKCGRREEKWLAKVPWGSKNKPAAWIILPVKMLIFCRNSALIATTALMLRVKCSTLSLEIYRQEIRRRLPWIHSLICTVESAYIKFRATQATSKWWSAKWHVWMWERWHYGPIPISHFCLITLFVYAQISVTKENAWIYLNIWKKMLKLIFHVDINFPTIL